LDSSLAQNTQQKLERRPNYLVFTIEVCSSCGFKMKRPFKAGDYIFKEGEECSHCKSKNTTMIDMIYAEAIKR